MLVYFLCLRGNFKTPGRPNDPLLALKGGSHSQTVRQVNTRTASTACVLLQQRRVSLRKRFIKEVAPVPSLPSRGWTETLEM